MSTQKAVVIVDKGHAELVPNRPIPKVRDRFILVKTVAVALNPTDWKNIHGTGTKGSLVGCDYAGIVEEVGKGVTKDLKKGDKVFGAAHRSDAHEKENGAFAQYIVAKGDLANKIPENLSFEEASTLGIGLMTVCHGMYMALSLSPPEAPIKETVPILIYGGSTATGSLGIQYAKLSGYTPITVCSPSNFEFVKGLGAVAAFDYHEPDCAKKIREYTNNSLKLVWDTVGLPDSADICAEALSSASGGKYYTILKQKSPRDDVESVTTIVYYLFGEPFEWDGEVQEVKQEEFQDAADFLAKATKLLAEGKIKPHPAKVGKDGLKGVLEGLQLMRENKVSGAKLVYKVDETP